MRLPRPLLFFLIGLAAPAAMMKLAPAPTPAPRAAAEAARPAGTQPTPPTVTVVRAVSLELAETVFVTGTAVPREEALIGPEIDGLRIVELLADEGDRVAAGQVLARLSRETLEIQLLQNAASLAKIDAALDQARAQVAQAEADLGWAKATLDRSKELDRRGFAAKETVDQKTAAANGAQARLNAAREGVSLAEADRRQAEAQRKDIELRLARTDIRAPVGGIVSRRAAKIGAIASGAQEALFRIIRDGAVEIEADVSETILARLKQGQPADIHPAGVETPRRGALRLVAPEVNRATRLGRVRIAIEGEPPPPGSFARAVIEIARRTAVTVPQSAVLAQADRAEAQVVANGVVETRAIKLGIRAEGKAQIEEGVREGEEVIAIAGTFVRQGDRVTPVVRAAAN